MRLRHLCALLITLAAASAAPAQAQLTCAANAAVPPTIRHEGLAELTGDITLTCTGSAPEGGISDNLTLTLGTQVTSKLLGGASEALLLVDEPMPGMQTLGVNLFEGTVSGNSVTFTGVPFADKQGTGLMRVLRITNVRANAAGVELAGAGATPLLAAVSISGATSIGVNNPVQTVAFVQPGAAFTVQCAEPGVPVNLTFSELFPTAFKTQGGTDQNMPGTIYNTESGFTPDPIISGVGTADTGTELGATLTGLPSGVQLSVPASITEGLLTITALEPAGGGAVPIVGGAATIVYEVTAANPLAPDTISIPVTVSHLPTAGAIVRGNLHPISTVMVASATDPIPRFADVSTALAFGFSCLGAPALSGWALAVLALGLLGVGLVVTRRRLTAS